MNELRRRAAFWRNLEYALDQMVEDVQSKSSDRWVNKSDSEYFEKVKQYLSEALAATRERYMQVLQSQIDAWKEEKELTEE